MNESVAIHDRRQSAPSSVSATRSPVTNSLLVWLVLLAFLALTNLFITFVGAGLERDPRASLFAWPSLAIFGLAGVVGIWFAHRTGFPAAWDARLSTRQRLLYPALVGLALGLVQVALEPLLHGMPFFAALRGLPDFNAPFPGSLLFYTGGAILVEVLYRLLPIPLLLWLVSNVVLRGRGQTQTFWVLALLTSAIEPLSQDLLAFQAGAVLLGAIWFPLHFVFNLVQAVAFRRYGFLAAIVVRVAMYLVWHIGYGNFICGC